MNAASDSAGGLPVDGRGYGVDRARSSRSGKEKVAKKKDSKKHKKSSKDDKKGKKTKKEKSESRSKEKGIEKRGESKRSREAEDRSEGAGISDRGDERQRKRKRDSESSRKTKRTRGDLPTGQLARTYFGEVNPISEDDYFRKSTEFRLWLRLCHNINFEDLSSTDARDLFEGKFVPAFNAGALEEVYYTGDIPAPLRREATATQHRWKLNLSATERDQLADLSDSVDYQTRHAKAESQK